MEKIFRISAENAHLYRQIIAASAGNVLEFYDFSIFGFLSDAIGDAFFSSSAIISAFAVFGVALVVRPLGGALRMLFFQFNYAWTLVSKQCFYLPSCILVGKFSDIFGRRKALIFAVSVMLISSTLIGCLPSFHDIGGWATAFLIILRMVHIFIK